MLTWISNVIKLAHKIIALKATVIIIPTAVVKVKIKVKAVVRQTSKTVMMMTTITVMTRSQSAVHGLVIAIILKGNM